jgi:hypothetical protein
MAKLPGWIRDDGMTQDDKGHILVHFHVRRWHPGFWLMWVNAFIDVLWERWNGRRSV